MKKILKNERGSEVIEFVILFPILIFLIFGAITFFLATYSKIIIADAAREGARAGALAATRDDVFSVAEKRADEVIVSAAAGALVVNDSDIVVSLTPDENEQYEIVKVDIKGKHKSLLPAAILGDLDISSSAVFKRENR